jgi:hypothetical protein
MSATSNKISVGVQTVYRALKTLAVWGVIALGGYLLFPIVSKYLSSFQVVTAIVVLNAIATITPWQEAARKPPRPKKEFLQKLMRSEPITPKHNPPRIAGGEFSSLADDEDRLFFADFAEFADVVNWWLADKHVGSCWRLQELPRGDVILNVDDSGPTLRRAYDVFHNQVRVGILEISRGYDYSAENPRVTTEIELYSVRLLSFDSIAGFLRDIAMHVCDDKAKGDDYFDANQAIGSALTKALWQNQQITEF